MVDTGVIEIGRMGERRRRTKMKRSSQSAVAI